MNFQISLMSKKILAWAVVFALTLSTIPTIVATHDDEDTINIENGVFAWDDNDDELHNDLVFYAHNASDDLSNITISVWKKLATGNWTHYDDGETDDNGEVVFHNVTSGEYMWSAYDGNEQIANEGGYSYVSNNYGLGHVGFTDDDIFLAYVIDGNETIDSAYVKIYNDDGTLVEEGYTDHEEDDNFTLFVSDVLDIGHYDFSIWEEYNNSDSLLQNGSFYISNETDSDYDEWFEDWDYEYEDDTVEIGFDPNTECDCDVYVYVETNVYDSDGNYVTSMYDDGYIYGNETYWWYQEFTADYTDYYDFYVNLYDDDENFEDSFTLYEIYLETNDNGDDDDDDEINDYIGAVKGSEGDEFKEDSYFEIYTANGSWVDGGNPNYEGIFVSTDLDEGWYYHYVYWSNETEDLLQKGPFYSYGNSTNHTVINVDMGIMEDEDEDGDPSFECSDNKTCDDAYFRAHQGSWDDGISNVTIQISKYDDNGTLEDYDVVYTGESGDAVSYDSPCGAYEWEATYFGDDIDDGTYQVWANCDSTNIEDYGVAHIGIIDSWDEEDDTEDYDEWFDDYDYDYLSSDTVEIGFDPNTECDCDVYVYVEIEVYDSDGYVTSMYDDGYIYGNETYWWYLEFTADHTDYYDFYANLYDDDGNWEDDFSYYDIYLETDDNNSDDYDEWFEDWDYEYESNDTVEIGFDPNTECDCDVYVYVETNVYDSDGNYVTSMYDDGYIYGNETYWWYQEFTADYTDYYDFYVNLYDDDENFEDSFTLYEIYLETDDNGGGGGDDYGVGHLGVIDDYEGDGPVNDYLGAVTEGDDFRNEAYFEIYDSDDELVDSGSPNNDGLFYSGNLAEGQYTEYVYYEEDGDLLQASFFYSYGNSSGNNSDYINVDMAVLEDEDEDGEANLFCEDGPCDDAFFKAHRGPWDNGVSNVTIEICKYEDDSDDCEYYDTIYTNETGDAFTFDGSCGTYEWEAIYDGNQIDGGIYWIWAGCGNTGGGGDYDEWFEDHYYDYLSSDTVEIGFDPNTECDCYVYVEVKIEVYDSDGYHVTSMYDDGYINGTEEHWWYLEFTADYTDYYNFYANLYDEDGNLEDDFSYYDIYLETDDNGSGGGDGDGIGHVGEIEDWEGDGYVNDYIGGVTEDGEFRTEAYFEIYDFENDEIVDSGYPNNDGLFVSYDLAEGEYIEYIYYEEYGDLLQASYIYSYGNSSGNNSDYINVDMAVLEDEDEDGEPNIFCEDGPCNDAFFKAHRGPWDNGVSDVTIEICKYEDDTDDCVYYDTIYTDDKGEAISYDDPCGTYEWDAIYDDNSIDQGIYQIWDCSNTGGGGDTDYDEWFDEYNFEVDGYEIKIRYDPDTECDCYVEIEVYVDIFKENNDPDDDGYVDSIYETHTIYNGEEAWFVQDWSALHYGEGQYEFYVYIYDQEYEHDEDDFWIYDVYLGDDDDYDLWFAEGWFDAVYDFDNNHIWDEIYISFIPDTDFEDGDLEILVEIKVFDEYENEVDSLSEQYIISKDNDDEFGMYVFVDEPGYYYFEINLYEGNNNETSRGQFGDGFIMSDEWFDATFQQNENNFFISLDPKTNYGGEIETSYYLEVFHLDENNDDWYQLEEQYRSATIKGENENDVIYFEVPIDEDGEYRFKIWMDDVNGNLEHFVDREFSVVSNQAPEINEVHINNVLAENAFLYEGQTIDISVDAFDPEGDELSFTWNMGDGSPAMETQTQNMTSYRYLDDRMYKLSIIVSDGKLETEYLFNLEVMNQAPILMTSYDDTADEGLTLSFTAETEDVMADEVKVTWDFEDGSSRDGNFIQYQFTDDGNYTIVVTARDEDGGETVEKIVVTIKNVAPIFSEFILPSAAQEGQALDFLISATDPGDDTITYTFDFGDNTALLLTTDGNVSHKFAEGDTFEIIICALDEDGGETCRTELLPVSLLEQLEEGGLPGFGLLGVISALGVMGILRRRTH